MQKKKRTFFEVIFKLITGSFGKNYFKILGLFLFEYVPVSYASGPAVEAGSETDMLIPEKPVVKQYLDIFYFPAVLMVEATEAQKTNAKLKEDIKQATHMLEKIYLETCGIYKITQSTFKRKPASHFSVAFVHFIDRNRNCYPSLHAQVLAELYNTFFDYEEVMPRDELTKRTVSILEACFLTKQHSINDIASGIAGVSMLDPKFSKERAEELLSNIFLHENYGMSQKLCNDIRIEMISLCKKLLDNSAGKSYQEVFSPPKSQ